MAPYEQCDSHRTTPVVILAQCGCCNHDNPDREGEREPQRELEEQADNRTHQNFEGSLHETRSPMDESAEQRTGARVKNGEGPTSSPVS